MPLIGPIVLEHLDKSQADVVAEAFRLQSPAPSNVTVTQAKDGTWSVRAEFWGGSRAMLRDPGGPHGAGGGPDGVVA